MKRTLSGLALVASSFALGACGGSVPPAAEPGAPEPAIAETGEPPGSDAEAGDDAAAAGADETWEGEAESTGAAPATGEDGGVTETRTTEVIAKVIKDNRAPFRACYEKGRKELPDLKGTLTLHFVLDPEGKVKLAELNLERSTIKSPMVADCAIAELKKLKFPPSSRGMESSVNYPFDFKP